MGRGRRTTLTAVTATRAPSAIALSAAERAQLGNVRLRRDGRPSTHPWVPAELWPSVRAHLLARSAQANPLLQAELCAYTPGETLALLGHPQITAWHERVRALRLSEQYETVVFVPCAKTKPWVGPAIKRSRLYSAYNQLRAERPDACFVTISEPLGIVAMADWGDFPQYDNPGLFRDDAQRSGMTTRQWIEAFGACYGTPFDEQARQRCLHVLGTVVGDFIAAHGDRRLVAFVDERSGAPSTHGEMLDVAVARSGMAVTRHPKRERSRISPLDYLRATLSSASHLSSLMR